MNREAKEFYFYHLVNKTSNMNQGLLSLQYMYNHKMFDLFDKNALKYKNRITGNWNILKYQGKENLTREEYIDALEQFRGNNGANYIYFFRFPPYKKLGQKIEELSKYKDIYRININDVQVQKIIENIFYGNDMSSTDNKLLDKTYYESIEPRTYFSKYNDKLEMNFSTLNHIGISFKNGCCPLKLLEKISFPESLEDVEKIEKEE